jgi:uncharacterized protein YbjT (DUF2867 family)
MLLVTGAASLVGRHTVQTLLEHDVPTRVLVSARAALAPGEFGRAALVTGDEADGRVLDAALASVRTLVLLTRAHPDRPALDRQLLAAAERHGVSRVIKLSVAGAAADAPVHAARWHWETERLLEASSFAWVVVRAHRPMQHVYAQIDSLCSQHAFYGCQGDGASVDVDVRDVAAVLTALARAPGHEGGVLELTGPTPCTAPQLGRLLGEAMGHPVQYVDCAPEVFVQGLLAAGLPRWRAEDRAAWQLQLRSGRFATPTDTVRAITGQAPASMREFAAEFAAALRYAAPPMARQRAPT